MSGLYWLLGLSATFGLLALLRKKREYLSGVDSVFLSGDPHHFIVVHVCLTFKSRLSYASFLKLVEDKFLIHRRFRQKIVQRKWKWHYYEEERNFELEKHVRRHTLPALANPTPEALQSQLESFISDLVRVPIDLSRPPWEFFLIEQYGRLGSACVFRVHHAIADGVTLMRLAMSMLRPVEGAEGHDESLPLPISSPGLNQTPEPNSERSATPGMTDDNNAHAPFRALVKYKKPRPTPAKTLVGKMVGVLKALSSFLILSSDPVGRLKPATPIQPHMAIPARWLRDPLPLSEIKQLAYATGTSVNDILFCVVAGALRAYCLKYVHAGEKVHTAKTIMWVSLQGTELINQISFGNKIGAAYLPQPLEVEDDIQRLVRVRDLTRGLQVAPDVYVSMMLLKILGLIPQPITQFMWNTFAFKSTNSMSNVPGPQHAVSMAGAELDRMVFFVPPQGTIASFITILSYNGFVQMGLLCDARVVEEPREILDLFQSEYHKLKGKIAALQEEGKLQSAMGLQEKDRARK